MSRRLHQAWLTHCAPAGFAMETQRLEAHGYGPAGNEI
jgi:hypothetical protein